VVFAKQTSSKKKQQQQQLEKSSLTIDVKQPKK